MGDLDGNSRAVLRSQTESAKFFFSQLSRAVRGSYVREFALIQPCNFLKSHPPPSPAFRLPFFSTNFCHLNGGSFFFSRRPPPSFSFRLFSFLRHFPPRADFAKRKAESFLASPSCRSAFPGTRQTAPFSTYLHIHSYGLRSYPLSTREISGYSRSDRTDRSRTRHPGRKISSSNIDIFTMCGFL